MNNAELIRSAAIFFCVSVICLITAGWIMIPPFLRKTDPCEENGKKTKCVVLNTTLLIGGAIAISLVLSLLLFGIAVRIEHYKALGLLPNTNPSQLPFSDRPGRNVRSF